MDPEKLLRKATSRKNIGDLENAIELLRDAYREISKESTIYSVDIFLRLPLYLQKARRNDEAWLEFNILLSKGYPNQMKTPEMIPMDHSIIYDKMPLFLQREGKKELAIKFGILSFFSSAIGLCRQKRTGELKAYASKEFYKVSLAKLLRKARREDLMERICIIMEEKIESLPNIDLLEISERIDKMIIK